MANTEYCIRSIDGMWLVSYDAKSYVWSTAKNRAQVWHSRRGLPALLLINGKQAELYEDAYVLRFTLTPTAYVIQRSTNPFA